MWVGKRTSIIYLLRNDLRIHDNECLKWANANADFVIPLYCFDPGFYLSFIWDYPVFSGSKTNELMGLNLLKYFYY